MSIGLFDIKEYRVWLNAGKDNWSWDGQYVKICYIDMINNVANVEIKVKNSIAPDESRRIYLSVPYGQLEIERLVYQNGKNIFYEGDIVEDMLFREKYIIRYHDGIIYLEHYDGELEKISDVQEMMEVVSLTGNIKENQDNWDKYCQIKFNAIPKTDEKSNEKTLENKTVSEELYDELSDDYKELNNKHQELLMDFTDLANEYNELKKEHKRLKTELQYAEYYLNETRELSKGKDKEIQKLQEENKKLKLEEYDKSNKEQQFDFFEEIMKMVEKYK